MKKIYLFMVIIFFINAMETSAQDSQNAVVYLESISKKTAGISTDMWDYIKTAAHNKFVFMAEAKRKKLLKTIKISITEIGKMSDFNGDSSYKESVLNYLNTEYSLMNEDYAKIVDMEEVAEQSYDLMEMYLLAKEKANTKLEEAANLLKIKTDEFAKKNNIELIENESKIRKNLEISDEVGNYYNKIFLIFFKNNKQEAYFIDSSNKGDINAMQQNLNTFNKYINEGLDAIKKISSYNNDNTLVEYCTILLNFYKNESMDKFPVYTDFFMKKEMFDKIKKVFDSKSQSEKTQADIDQYNLQINEFNKAINKYNKVNGELNKERQKLLQDWNNTVKRFMDINIPK
jgi:hypothetical protein